MPLARTTPLRSQIEAALPERPFTVRFWDGTTVPATAGNGDGPTFTVRAFPSKVAVYVTRPEDLKAAFAADPAVLRAGEANAMTLQQQ